MITLLCRPDLAVGTAVAELRNLNELGANWIPEVEGAKRQHSAAKGKIGMVAITESRVKATIRIL